MYIFLADNRRLATYDTVEAAHDAIYAYAADRNLDVICVEADASCPGALDAFVAAGFTATVLTVNVAV